ncbi:arylamine N-acetyltransferase [Nonomuraea sp. NPDC046570]|uniref:arylamine N-acetyltransferase family protein n=1 Tax=Nonomuraea sp. NPDC046570 TaxID=3155255 RepID=UPI0033E97548
MNESHVAAYLGRIAAGRPERADASALARLQRAHLAAVPFENLAIHLGEPVVLSEDALFDKIVQRRRGGFCYELNGAFALLLTALGYQVTLLSARVFGGERPGPPFDHMALRVDLDEPWLVDVGFGTFAHHPLRLRPGVEQRDPAGVAEIVEHGPHGDLDVHLNGEPQYRLDPRGYDLDDFVPTCWFQQTSPDSHFTRSLTCSRLTDRGRITLSGSRLIETADGERTERPLAEDEILPAYRAHFGITLERVPVVRAS